MTNFQKYDNYKNSGVEWLGEVPGHWEVRRLKFQTNLVSEKVVSKNSPLEYLGMENIESWTGNLIESTTETEGLASRFSKGDVLFGKLRPYLAKVFLTEKEGICSTEFLVYRTKREVSSVFLKYLMLSPSFINLIDSSTYGSKMPRANSEFIGNQLLPIPPLPEQTRIAHYLDEKTAQIDRAIAQKQQQIELLRERRQIIIQRAVTRGLDASVPMKDSGVAWIGEVPGHWEVKPLKFLGKCQNGISKGAEFFGFGFPFVSYSDVYKNDSLPPEVSGLANASIEDKRLYSVQVGDVFFTRTSETIEEIGMTSVCLSTIPEATFAGFLIRFRPQKGILFEGFSKFYFRSAVHRAYFVGEMNLVIRASLSQEFLKKFPVLLPPIHEQMAISIFLQTATQKIAHAIQLKEKEIEKLKEYKSVLIDSAVTGKVRIA